MGTIIVAALIVAAVAAGIGILASHEKELRTFRRGVVAAATLIGLGVGATAGAIINGISCDPDEVRLDVTNNQCVDQSRVHVTIN